MYQNSPLKRIAAVVLLFVLVSAEAMAVAHALDLDAHASGDPCKICVSAAGLASAAPASAAPAQLPRADVPVATAQNPLVPAQRPERASARGPPLVS